MQEWNLRQCEARGVFNDGIFFFQWSDQTFLFPKDACSLCQWLQEISCIHVHVLCHFWPRANAKGMNLFMFPFIIPSSYGSILWFRLTKKSNTNNFAQNHAGHKKGAKRHSQNCVKQSLFESIYHLTLQIWH